MRVQTQQSYSTYHEHDSFKKSLSKTDLFSDEGQD